MLKAHGIPVIDLNVAGEVALYVDGADEVNLQFELIKHFIVPRIFTNKITGTVSYLKGLQQGLLFGLCRFQFDCACKRQDKYIASNRCFWTRNRCG